MPPIHAQHLLPSEVAFMTAMQALGFGRFEFLQFRGGELILDPWPTAVRDVKFWASPSAGNTMNGDGDLRPQVRELFTYVRDAGAGEIRRLEIRHGLPFLMEIETVGENLCAPKGGRRG